MPIRIHSPTPIFKDKRWTVSCHSEGRFTYAPCGQGVAGQVTTGPTQQGRGAVQRHAELVLAGNDLGLGLLREQPARDDACPRWSDLQALITAGAGVLNAMVLEHPHLYGDDVKLFANARTDLHQSITVIGTDSLGLLQLVAHDLAWQCWVHRLAAWLLALVPDR